MSDLPEGQEWLERFRKNFRPGPRGCVEWWGTRRAAGYGVFYCDGKTFHAHRTAYVLARGPIPDGLQIDHLCRNRACVNAAHLEAVTQKVNILRGIAPPAKNARRTECQRGHALSGENLIIRKNGTRLCKACTRAGKAAWDQKQRDAKWGR